MADSDALASDAKQGALDVSTTAIAIFDYIDKYGPRAMQRREFLALLSDNHAARRRMFDALEAIGEFYLAGAMQ